MATAAKSKTLDSMEAMPLEQMERFARAWVRHPCLLPNFFTHFASQTLKKKQILARRFVDEELGLPRNGRVTFFKGYYEMIRAAIKLCGFAGGGHWVSPSPERVLASLPQWVSEVEPHIQALPAFLRLADYYYMNKPATLADKMRIEQILIHTTNNRLMETIKKRFPLRPAAPAPASARCVASALAKHTDIEPLRRSASAALIEVLRALWRPLRAGASLSGALHAAAKDTGLEVQLLANTWTRARRVALYKLRVSAELGDARPLPPAAPAPADALALALALLYQPEPLVTEATIREREHLRLLTLLLSLVQHFRLDAADEGIEGRWRDAAAAYACKGYAAGLLVLQRRWFDLVSLTRRSLAAYARAARARAASAPAALDPPPPSPPVVCAWIADRFPQLMTSPLPDWETLVAGRKVYCDGVDVILGGRAAPREPEGEPWNSDLDLQRDLDPVEDDDDLQVIEKEYETVELHSSDEDRDQRASRTRRSEAQRDVCTRLDAELQRQLTDIRRIGGGAGAALTPPTNVAVKQEVDATPAEESKHQIDISETVISKPNSETVDDINQSNIITTSGMEPHINTQKSDAVTSLDPSLLLGGIDPSEMDAKIIFSDDDDDDDSSDLPLAAIKSAMQDKTNEAVDNVTKYSSSDGNNEAKDNLTTSHINAKHTKDINIDDSVDNVVNNAVSGASNKRADRIVFDDSDDERDLVIDEGMNMKTEQIDGWGEIKTEDINIGVEKQNVSHENTDNLVGLIRDSDKLEQEWDRRNIDAETTCSNILQSTVDPEAPKVRDSDMPMVSQGIPQTVIKRTKTFAGPKSVKIRRLNSLSKCCTEGMALNETNSVRTVAPEPESSTVGASSYLTTNSENNLALKNNADDRLIAEPYSESSDSGPTNENYNKSMRKRKHHEPTIPSKRPGQKSVISLRMAGVANTTTRLSDTSSDEDNSCTLYDIRRDKVRHKRKLGSNAVNYEEVGNDQGPHAETATNDSCSSDKGIAEDSAMDCESDSDGEIVDEKLQRPVQIPIVRVDQFIFWKKHATNDTTINIQSLCVDEEREYSNNDSAQSEALQRTQRKETEATRPPAERTQQETDATRTYAERTELETDATRPPAERTQQETDATRPYAERTELEADATRPYAERTELETDATRPPAERTQQETDATRPYAERTELATDATRPYAERTELETDATRPPAERTQQETDATRPYDERTELETDATRPYAERQELETDATRPPAERTQQETDATRPSAERTELETDAIRPPAERIEQETDATRPLAERTQQETDATRPPAERTQQETDATRPPTERTQQETDATRPPAERTQQETDATRPPAKRGRGGKDTVKKYSLEDYTKLKVFEFKDLPQEFVRAHAPLLALCTPVTVEVKPMSINVFSHYNVYGPICKSRGRARVQLSDIEEVRRRNRALLTAQVRPITHSLAASTLCDAGAEGGGGSGGGPWRLTTWARPVSRSLRGGTGDDADPGGGKEPSPCRPPHNPDVANQQDTLTPGELAAILDHIREERARAPAAAAESSGRRKHCCHARRHLAYNMARARAHVKKNKPPPPIFDLHSEAGGKHALLTCSCCCLDALRAAPSHDALRADLAALRQHMRRLLSHKAHAPSASPETEPERETKEHSHAHDKKPSSTNKKRDKKKRATELKAAEEKEREAQDREKQRSDDYAEYMRQKTQYAKYFTLSNKRPVVGEGQGQGEGAGERRQIVTARAGSRSVFRFDQTIHKTNAPKRTTNQRNVSQSNANQTDVTSPSAGAAETCGNNKTNVSQSSSNHETNVIRISLCVANSLTTTNLANKSNESQKLNLEMNITQSNSNRKTNVPQDSFNQATDIAHSDLNYKMNASQIDFCDLTEEDSNDSEDDDVESHDYDHPSSDDNLQIHSRASTSDEATEMASVTQLCKDPSDNVAMRQENLTDMLNKLQSNNTAGSRRVSVRRGSSSKEISQESGIRCRNQPKDTAHIKRPGPLSKTRLTTAEPRDNAMESHCGGERVRQYAAKKHIARNKSDNTIVRELPRAPNTHCTRTTNVVSVVSAQPATAATAAAAIRCVEQLQTEIHQTFVSETSATERKQAVAFNFQNVQQTVGVPQMSQMCQIPQMSQLPQAAQAVQSAQVQGVTKVPPWQQGMFMLQSVQGQPQLIIQPAIQLVNQTAPAQQSPNPELHPLVRHFVIQQPTVAPRPAPQPAPAYGSAHIPPPQYYYTSSQHTPNPMLGHVIIQPSISSLMEPAECVTNTPRPNNIEVPAHIVPQAAPSQAGLAPTPQAAPEQVQAPAPVISTSSPRQSARSLLRQPVGQQSAASSQADGHTAPAQHTGNRASKQPQTINLVLDHDTVKKMIEAASATKPELAAKPPIGPAQKVLIDKHAPPPTEQVKAREQLENNMKITKTNMIQKNTSNGRGTESELNKMASVKMEKQTNVMEETVSSLLANKSLVVKRCVRPAHGEQPQVRGGTSCGGASRVPGGARPAQGDARVTSCGGASRVPGGARPAQGDARVTSCGGASRVLGGARPAQGVPGGARPAQGVPGGARPAQGVQGGARPAQGVPGGARPAQGVPGGARPARGDARRTPTPPTATPVISNVISLADRPKLPAGYTVIKSLPDPGDSMPVIASVKTAQSEAFGPNTLVSVEGKNGRVFLKLAPPPGAQRAAAGGGQRPALGNLAAQENTAERVRQTIKNNLLPLRDDILQIAKREGPKFSYREFTSAPPVRVTDFVAERAGGGVRLLCIDTDLPLTQLRRHYLVLTEDKVPMARPTYWTMAPKGECRNLLFLDSDTPPPPTATATAGPADSKQLAPAPRELHTHNSLYKKLSENPLVYGQVWSVLSTPQMMCSVITAPARPNLALYDRAEGELHVISRIKGPAGAGGGGDAGGGKRPVGLVCEAAPDVMLDLVRLLNNYFRSAPDAVVAVFGDCAGGAAGGVICLDSDSGDDG